MPRSARAPATSCRQSHRVADDARDDGAAVAHAGVDAARAARVEEEAGAPCRLRDELGVRLELAQRAERGGRVRRRDADGVDEAGGRVLEVLDERVRPGDVAAAARERLRQRAHPQLDVGAVDAEVLADAAAGRAEHAERVRLVDEQHAPCASS